MWLKKYEEPVYYLITGYLFVYGWKFVIGFETDFKLLTCLLVGTIFSTFSAWVFNVGVSIVGFVARYLERIKRG